jgi:Ferritin-like domain
MATQETQQLDSIIASRRALLVGGGALATLALAGAAQAQSTTVTDTDILNFALNLEYLEAEFYTLATAGATIDQSAGGSIGIGTGTATTGGGTVTAKGNNNYASCKVPFANSTIAAYATETATEERKHVSFLRSALGSSAVAQPNVDLYNSFLALGNAVGVSNYDPFANDLYFILGAYIFEDVGVSAYHGAAALISSTANLAPAAGIQAVEAYHAGLIRTTIYGVDQGSIVIPGIPGAGAAALATKISAVRATFDGTSTKTPDDVGLTTVQVALNSTSGTPYTSSTIVNADANSIAWARTTAQVLSIVYAGGTGQGGFYPNGLNGNIK